MGKIKLTLHSLMREVEKITSNTIERGYQNDFVEDTISENLIANLKDLLKTVEIKDSLLQTKFLCEAYKIRKPVEELFGDIAVMVKIHYPDKSILQGVGFLEAKLKSKSTKKFEAFKICQIHRIFGSVPKIFLLAYDNNCIKCCSEDIDVTVRFDCRACYPVPEHIYAAVVPGDIVIKDGGLTTDSYKNAVPFSYQFCYRYLQGFDLQINQSVYETIDNYIRHYLK